eukprot:TRINITY_DN10048_c0_g1_i1.p1 TRINITY_DN10048_c0_g1~~TRINITY_DN10048_c0_g1_i1.p1  ORF type:complete len:160 (-),score=38.10 TRINITY_DN10048_c0_g1_i1:74-553(-)
MWLNCKLGAVARHSLRVPSQTRHYANAFHKVPSEVKLLKNKKELQVTWNSGEVSSFPAELLRVESPSAEVRGHAPGEKKLVDGKLDVTIITIEPRGNYAISIVFDDFHDSGIYSWEFLYNLHTHQEEIWKNYLNDLEKAGKSRYRAAVKKAACSHPNRE